MLTNCVFYDISVHPIDANIECFSLKQYNINNFLNSIRQKDPNFIGIPKDFIISYWLNSFLI